MGNQGRARYPEHVVQQFVADRIKGMPNKEACQKYGINLKSGDSWMFKHRQSQARVGLGKAPPPKTPGMIRKHRNARLAFEDFAYFRLACFGYKTPPWALQAVEELRQAVETRNREFVCMNVFPGAGKSSLMMHFVCWLIVRDRTIRILWGSASETLAQKWVNGVRIELGRTEPGEGYEDDIASGRAVKPRYCIVDLFGSFRPSAHHGTIWQVKEFTVSTPGDGINGEGPPPPGPTLVAVGRDTKQLGKRANFIVWDDLWTKEENDNPEVGKKVKRFFDATIETRLQPNGTLVLVMQRLGPADLSRYVLDKRMPTLDEMTGEETGWEPEYRHIVYPAHHDDLCDGLHPAGRPAWDPLDPQPGHCLTDPEALPPKDFVRIRSKPVYLVEYQQRDVDPQGAIFREIWLTGGRDEDGDHFRGCLNLTRGLWEPPEGVPLGTLASAAAIDPGHENYWGLYASLSSMDVNSEREWVLAAEHRRMPMGTERGLLDWDFERKCFVGILEEWYQRSKDIGAPFSHVVSEINAAQRHLFRLTNVIDKWQQTRQCRIVTHSTGRNKIDPKMGVEHLIAMRLQTGAVDIPWRKGETQDALRSLYNEIVGYKQGWPTDDVLMAMWMRTLKRRSFHRTLVPVGPDRDGGARRGRSGHDWVAETPKLVRLLG